MKTAKKRELPRWGILAIIAIILLLIAGTLYAQGSGPRPGMQGRGGGPGMGMGRGMGPGQGGGPGRMGGMAFLMQDEDIRDLIAKIKLIEGINELELSIEQVEIILDASQEARGLLDDKFGDLRNEIRNALQGQLNSVLRGEEFEQSVFERIREEMQSRHDPGELREQIAPIVDRVWESLTEEQRQKITEHMGPGGQAIRERIGQGRGQQWFQSLDEEQRAELEGRFRARMQEMQAGTARMKVLGLLLAPQTVETLELWLDAQ